MQRIKVASLLTVRAQYRTVLCCEDGLQCSWITLCDLFIFTFEKNNPALFWNKRPEQELLSPSCTAAEFTTTPVGSVLLISQWAGFPPAVVQAPLTAARPIWGMPLWLVARSTDRWVVCLKQRKAPVCMRQLSLRLQGCYELVTAFIECNMGIIAGVTFGIAFSQVYLQLLLLSFKQQENQLQLNSIL